MWAYNEPGSCISEQFWCCEQRQIRFFYKINENFRILFQSLLRTKNYCESVNDYGDFYDIHNTQIHGLCSHKLLCMYKHKTCYMCIWFVFINIGIVGYCTHSRINNRHDTVRCALLHQNQATQREWRIKKTTNFVYFINGRLIHRSTLVYRSSKQQIANDIKTATATTKERKNAKKNNWYNKKQKKTQAFFIFRSLSGWIVCFMGWFVCISELKRNVM